MIKELYTHSAKETMDLAKDLAHDAKPGTIIALDGDLGAGKTVFAKGYALGLGILEMVVSPTFTLMHEYKKGRLPFFHFDAYRLSEPEEMFTLGFEEYFFDGGVSLIEWAGKIRELIPPDALWIQILKDVSVNPDLRKILIG